MAIFDAYGAGLEFVKPTFFKQHHTLAGYTQHPKHKGIKPGWYTDDTQMAIAIAELMLDKDTADPKEWTTRDVAMTFMRAFSRDPREGYAGGFYQVLKQCDSVSEMLHHKANLFLAKIRPHSRRNGGAMRAGPIGLLPTTDDVVDRAMFQASLTHATWEGMMAAAASALMVHYFHYELGPKKRLPQFLEGYFPMVKWDVPFRGRVRMNALDAVRAAMTAIWQSDTMIDVLRHAVDFGGDTDTTAAIAGCAASRSVEVAQIIPVGLHKGLENGTLGRRLLRSLDERLLEKYPPPSVTEADDLVVTAEDNDSQRFWDFLDFMDE
jgi:ADP-ribosylglycohydrolase